MSEILYHGSSFKVKKPKILTSGFYKDFGYGFYCTNIEKQAKRWAIVKGKTHIVNVYSYEEDMALSILKFDDMTEEWLDFVINCRRGIEHSYDIGLYRGLYRRKNNKRGILGACKVQVPNTSDRFCDRTSAALPYI